MVNNVIDAAIRLRDLFTPTVRSANASLGTMNTQMAAAKQSVYQAISAGVDSGHAVGFVKDMTIAASPSRHDMLPKVSRSARPRFHLIAPVS